MDAGLHKFFTKFTKPPLQGHAPVRLESEAQILRFIQAMHAKDPKDLAWDLIGDNGGAADSKSLGVRRVMEILRVAVSKVPPSAGIAAYVVPMLRALLRTGTSDAQAGGDDRALGTILSEVSFNKTWCITAQSCNTARSLEAGA